MLDNEGALERHLEGGLNLKDDPDTGVLKDAEFVYSNAIDVAVNMQAIKAAAAILYSQMRQKGWSTAIWSAHELHPKSRDESTVAFIFTMSTLNFSFWSDRPDDERFAVWYRGKKWTGYWTLVASLQRALEEGSFI